MIGWMKDTHIVLEAMLVMLLYVMNQLEEVTVKRPSKYIERALVLLLPEDTLLQDVLNVEPLRIKAVK